MKSTKTWVCVTDEEGRKSVRMLHVDTQGRKCVRYGKAWRLVEEKQSAFSNHYAIKGLV